MSDPGLEAYIASVRGEFEARLEAWVGIPTISAFPDRRGDIDRGAAAAVDYLNSLGARADIKPTEGNPVVVGKFLSDPAHPTVTVYNHLDVQPADEPEWETEPFVMRNESGTYIGRGTTDDKGPALTALMAARYAHDTAIPLNVHFIWELEEEIGSPSFESFLAENVEGLSTDSVVISDTIWVSRSRPAIPRGLRGLLSILVSLETGTKDVHSGLTGGGARNPLAEICALMARCHDASTGRVRIDGFYDDVVAATDKEIEGFVASGFSAALFKQAHELKLIRSTDPAELVRRIWTEPTFEVHGILGGYTGPGVKTAIPPRAEAKISMRLVPGQSPRKIFEIVRAFIDKENPDVKVELDSALAPFLGPDAGPYADAAIDAMKTAFGTTPALVREGGSIGAVVTMEQYLQAPIVFLGLSLPEHGYHAPNENFDWQQASGGIRMFVRYFENVAEMTPSL